MSANVLRAPAPVRIVHTAILHASRVAILRDRAFELWEDKLPTASGQPHFEATWREWRAAEEELARLTRGRRDECGARYVGAVGP